MSTKKAIILLTLTCIIWGTTFTVIKDITYKNQIERNVIELVFFVILFIMDIVASLHFNTNMLFSDSIIYNFFYDFFYNFFEGFIDGFLFS